MNWSKLVTALCSLVFMATMPASSNFKLNSYGFGSGGTSGSSSANYKINGTAGEQAGSASSSNYKVGAGENYLKQANVPSVTVTNVNDWYDKLQLFIGIAGNPSDATYAVAISPDNFTTTYYVQSDFTIGSTLNASNFLSYTAWGSGSGATVRGLTPSTVYSVKAVAMRGKFTQSGFGPVATGTTPTYSITSPPYALNMGSLLAGSVYTASNQIWLTITTNGDSGALLFGGGQYGGLNSTSTGQFISSSTVDLATLSQGFGEQDTSATQTSGGPLVEDSPYNVTGTNIGQDANTYQEWFTSINPIVNGEGSVSLLAKTSATTPAAPDYTETLTTVAASTF
jgi:hypothetical protein